MPSFITYPKRPDQSTSAHKHTLTPAVAAAKRGAIARRQTCSSFYGAAQGRGEEGGGVDWCVAVAMLTLKVGVQPETRSRFTGVFSLLQQIYLYNKKEQQSAEAIRGRGKNGPVWTFTSPVPVLPAGLKQTSQLVTHSAHCIKMHIKMI